MSDYSNKSIAVIGIARTGLAVAEVMRERGARVILYDKKPESDLAEPLARAHELGVETRPGADLVDLSGIDILVPSPGVGVSAFQCRN